MGKKAIGYPRKDSTLACAFCNSSINDEIEYGPMYTIGNITCHYFCVLLSTKLIQRGTDKEGVLGFTFNDIQSELRLAKTKRCHYCKEYGATIYCCQRSCYLLFHLPCGKNNGGLSLFYKTYQSFCGSHRSHQRMPSTVCNRKRMIVSLSKIQFKKKYTHADVKQIILNSVCEIRKKTPKSDKIDVCFVCYEEIIMTESMDDLFWPPCCKANTLFHKRCLSRMALSAGKHHIRCPLCNNSKSFVSALYNIGIYIPEQDASWEKVDGAFNDLLYRPNKCTAEVCKATLGRTTDDAISWKLIICNTCGSEAVHGKCIDLFGDIFECYRCKIPVSNAEEEEDIYLEQLPCSSTDSESFPYKVKEEKVDIFFNIKEEPSSSFDLNKVKPLVKTEKSPDIKPAFSELYAKVNKQITPESKHLKKTNKIQISPNQNSKSSITNYFCMLNVSSSPSKNVIIQTPKTKLIYSPKKSLPENSVNSLHKYLHLDNHPNKISKNKIKKKKLKKHIESPPYSIKTYFKTENIESNSIVSNNVYENRASKAKFSWRFNETIDLENECGSHTSAVNKAKRKSKQINF